MQDLTLIIPAKIEPDSLPYVLMELEKLNLNYIIVMEKSDFVTANAVEKFKSKIIFQNNKGYGDAVKFGLQHVKTKYFSIMHADGSTDPNEISKFYNELKEKNLDLLFGTRYSKNGDSEDDTFITYIGNKIFTLIGKIFFSLLITDILYTYVIGNTEKILNLNLKQADYRFCIELPIKAKRKNLQISDIGSNEKKRISGTKKVNELIDGFLILKEMIYLFFNHNR